MQAAPEGIVYTKAKQSLDEYALVRRCCNLGQDHSPHRASFHSPHGSANHIFHSLECSPLPINSLPQHFPLFRDYPWLVLLWPGSQQHQGWAHQSRRKERLEWLIRASHHPSAHNRREDTSPGPVESIQVFIFPSKYIASGGKTSTDTRHYIRKYPWASVICPVTRQDILCLELHSHPTPVPAAAPTHPFTISLLHFQPRCCWPAFLPTLRGRNTTNMVVVATAWLSTCISPYPFPLCPSKACRSCSKIQQSALP